MLTGFLPVDRETRTRKRRVNSLPGLDSTLEATLDGASAESEEKQGAGGRADSLGRREPRPLSRVWNASADIDSPVAGQGTLILTTAHKKQGEA